MLILLLGLLIGALTQASRALAGVVDGRASLLEAKTALERFDWEVAGQSLASAETQFESANDALGWFAPVGVIPGFGKGYRAGRALVHAGAVASRSFGSTLSVGTELLSLVGSDESILQSGNVKGDVLQRWNALSRDERQFILTRLKTRLPLLEVASNDLHLTVEELDEAFLGLTPSVLVDAKQVLVDRVREAETYLDVMVEGGTLLTSLSDEDGGTVLLLFLNDNELRPGGGFLGSFGILSLDAGAIRDLKTYDVMAVDAPVLQTRTTPAPAPLSEYLGVPAWFLRDANWSPDFAVSSERTLQFLREELAASGASAVLPEDLHVDAVVGMTTSVASDVLAILGPIEVDGERFTADTIADVLENAVEFTFVNRGLTQDRRKDIIQSIANIMRERMVNLSLNDWSRVFTSVAVRLRDKHLMFYSQDPNVERLFEREGWGGRVAERFQGDYVMAVDANLAALKTDAVMRRTWSYSIRPDADGLLATLRLSYQNTGTFGPKTTRYRTFTRVYVPEGSTLVGVEGSLANDRLKNAAGIADEPVVSEELGKTVFGAFTSVEPGETHDLVFTYRLPDWLNKQVQNGTYDLQVQKPLGSQNHALTLDLDFGKKLTQASPGEDPTQWGDTTYRLNTFVDQDRLFEVDF